MLRLFKNLAVFRSYIFPETTNNLQQFVSRAKNGGAILVVVRTQFFSNPSTESILGYTGDLAAVEAKFYYYCVYVEAMVITGKIVFEVFTSRPFQVFSQEEIECEQETVAKAEEAVLNIAREWPGVKIETV